MLFWDWQPRKSRCHRQAVEGENRVQTAMPAETLKVVIDCYRPVSVAAEMQSSVSLI